MIASHRNHRFESGVLELDRLIDTSGVLRRVFTRGLTQEESLTVDSVGRGSEDRLRAQVMIVLTGELRSSVAGRSIVLTPGTIVAVDRVADLVTHRGEGLSFSIDWAAERSVAGSGRLGARAVSAIARIAASVRTGRSSAAKISVLDEILRAQGIAFTGLGTSAGEGRANEAEAQRYMSVMDSILSNLEQSPASADWSDQTGATRRTLTRRTHAVYQTYSLFGMRKQTDWRAVRDHYRILISTILLTEETATVASVARAVGYRSAAAMCYAYAHAGLPSPGRVRAIARAA